jgi:hypothetical protein
MLIQENQVVRLFNLSSYIRDPDGDTLAYTVDGALYVGVTIGADGWVTFSPSSNWSGSETFKFVGEDAAGLRVSTVFNLTVEPVNSAPELSHPAVSPAKGDSATTFTFTVVCRDIDSANVTVKLIVGRRILVMERVSGNLTVGATYQVKTTLTAGENSFYFQVDDGEKSHATSSQELSVTAQPTDNTVIYLGLGVITIVVILLALVFTPSRKKKRWEELDEEE